MLLSRASFVAVLCVGLAGSAAWAEEAACKLPRGVAAEVASVIDGETLKLADGREVRLLGVLAPRVAGGRAGSETYATEAQQFLAELVQGQPVLLHQNASKKLDRYGRLLAHVTRAKDGLWLQEKMLATGHARMQGTREQRLCLSRLMEVEGAARSSALGLWAESAYWVQDASAPERLLRLEGTYQLVEGTIIGVASLRKRLYFNFGTEWKTDFTVTVEPAEARLFLAADASGSPQQQLEQLRAAWEGKRVRVRGWLGKYNGPEIRVTYPEQMEVLTAPAMAEQDARD